MLITSTASVIAGRRFMQIVSLTFSFRYMLFAPGVVRELSLLQETFAALFNAVALLRR